MILLIRRRTPKCPPDQHHPPCPRYRDRNRPFPVHHGFSWTRFRNLRHRLAAGQAEVNSRKLLKMPGFVRADFEDLLANSFLRRHSGNLLIAHNRAVLAIDRLGDFVKQQLILCESVVDPQTTKTPYKCNGGLSR